MDAATRAGWESGFGAILKNAERVTSARWAESRDRRWMRDARRWWDDEPDEKRPTEVEAVKRVFHTCKNAARVSDVLASLAMADFRRSWHGVDAEDWAAFDDVVTFGRDMPRQLPLPMVG
jgi:hypothetical protein